MEIKKIIYYRTADNEQESEEYHADDATIRLSSRNIAHIDFNYFKGFEYLKRLDLSSNEITSVCFTPLSDCKRLEKLDLSSNMIKEIDLTPLLNCERLEELNLSYNSIEHPNFSQLSGHPTLKKIILRANRIAGFSFSSLEDIPNLTAISLQGNHLESVNLGALANCQKMMHLNLSWNSIRKVDLSPLRESRSFRSLSLSGNKIESIELVHLSDVETFESLELSSNQIRKIDLYSIQNCRLIKRIYLDDNNLQELDITPLFSCPHLSELRIDGGILLWAVCELRNSTYVPEGIQTHRGKILYQGTVEKKKGKAPKKTKNEQKKIHFIDSSDFSGKMYELITEINEAFNSKCYVCTTFLSRKLMENLVISIMTKIFGKTKPEYYVKMDKQGSIIGNQRFHDVLKKFWQVYRSEIAQFSSLHDKKQLTRLEKKMIELKNNFNVDVHQLGTFRDEKELLGIRTELGNIISFLRTIDKRIK